MNLLPPRLHLELLQQHPRSLLEVQGVDVQSSDTYTGLQDISTHLSDQLGPDFTYSLVIIFDRQEYVPKVLRNDDTLPLHPGHELLPRLNRHDTGYDRYVDPSRSNPFDPIHKDPHVVEHLSEDEVGSGIDLGF
jgi:hypothetical protein